MRRVLVGVVLVALGGLVGVGCDGDGPPGEAFCDLVEDARGELQEGDGDFDVPRGISEVFDRIGDLVDAAPDEVADDVRTVRESFEQVVEEERPLSPRQVRAATRAERRVKRYVRETCGVRNFDLSDIG